MKRRRVDRSRVPESLELARQKADFTAEGAPPPGRVAGVELVRPAATKPRPRLPHR